MNIVNETPFTFAQFAGKVVYPKDTLTLIVKGTFQLKPDGPVQAMAPEAQKPPSGDLYYDDDPHASVRYESDFTHFKPKADVLLVGHCHVPDTQLAPACAVRFQAGPIAKSLMVFGNRTWQRTVLGTRAQSKPEPFTSMALRYENSFGGPGYKRNPVGKGIRPKSNGQESLDHTMPNLKVLEGDQLSTMHAGIPAGFGPLGRTWSQRMALVGSYGAKWKKERWPWLPEDFDWGYFNAAPTDQQLKSYLKGDETLYFKNLHPQHKEWHTALPGTRVRCFLAEHQGNRQRFREVITQLDTLWVDMDASLLVLVWRGLAVVAAPGCEQIDAILIVQESMAEAPCPVEHYEQLLVQRKAEAAAAAVPMIEEAPQVEAGPAAGNQAAAAQEEADILKAMALAHAALDHPSLAHALPGQAGIDPNVLTALQSENDPERFLELAIQGLNIDPASAGAFKAQARQKAMENLNQHRAEAKALLDQHGIDSAFMDEVDLFSDEAQGPALPVPPDREALAATAKSADGVGDQDLTGVDFSGMALEGANFKGAQLVGANFSKARLAGADFSEAMLANANFEEADLAQAKFVSADVSQGSFDGANLAGADFSDALMMDVRMQCADLKNANLSRAQMGRADLSQAVLPSANLEQADLSNAKMTQADLTKARLDFAILDGADLTQANLKSATGKFTSWRQSILSQANFSHATLEESNFSQCRCDFTNFESAHLARATFEFAVGREVNFRRALLDEVRAGEKVCMPDSIFRRASGAKANWAGADLRGADFILAVLTACDFSHADLTGCDGRTADMKHSVFDQATLTNAKFNRANLFQVRLEQAQLMGANFKGCNLYGSEFLNAFIDKRTNFKQANLKATKLVTFTS